MESGITLIVDDDPSIRETLKDALQIEQYPAAVAGNGQEALEWLQQHRPPSLILLDLMMPVMNGWEFRREQLQDTALAGIPTILITAHSRADENTVELQASGLLRKPAQPNVLLETVGKYCS
jgi:CheY-like chemotaxis protein